MKGVRSVKFGAVGTCFVIARTCSNGTHLWGHERGGALLALKTTTPLGLFVMVHSSTPLARAR